jgi:hypothetical protein
MATKEKLLEELNYLTEKISLLVWTLNVGVLGTTWSLLIQLPFQRVSVSAFATPSEYVDQRASLGIVLIDNNNTTTTRSLIDDH